jgi:PiT family inorganic phosphate transporter
LAGHAHATHADVFVVLTSALLAALVWGVVSWWRVWPTSTNHALFGGLLGSSWVVWGANHLQNKLIGRVFLILILTPVIGFLLSAMVTAFMRWIGEWLTRRVQRFADGLHVAACIVVAGAHGSNDGQMIMGFLVGILGMAPSSAIPFRVRTVVATGLALGVLFGGRNLLKKLGMKFYRIRSLQGLGAELTSAGTVLLSGAAGFPASTTQVIAGSIVGAGVAKNAKAVRWPVAQDIILSWLITLPAAAALAFAICSVARMMFKGAV